MNTYPSIPLTDIFAAATRLRETATAMELHAHALTAEQAQAWEGLVSENRRVADRLIDWAWIEGIEVVECALKTEPAPIVEAAQ